MEARIPIMVEPDEATVRVCIALVEAFLNAHPDYDLRVMEREDGTNRYSVVMFNEPCNH